VFILLDTPAKKRLIFSIIMYFPIISLIAGAPIPFPSLTNPTQEQIAVLNFSSLIVSLVGTLIGGIFYLERRNNLKLEKQNEKIDKIDVKIDDKSEWLYNEMKNVEVRICSNMTSKLSDIDKHSLAEVKSAKELVDTKFKHVESNQQIMRKSIAELERGYHRSTKYSSHIDVEEESPNNNGNNNGENEDEEANNNYDRP
jgi:hypothetical protein